MLATRMHSQADLRTTMKQGGWADSRLVMGYVHDVTDHRREVVRGLPIGDGVDGEIARATR
jgi:hypothetical protein